MCKTESLLLLPGHPVPEIINDVFQQRPEQICAANTLNMNCGAGDSGKLSGMGILQPGTDTLTYCYHSSDDVHQSNVFMLHEQK